MSAFITLATTAFTALTTTAMSLFSTLRAMPTSKLLLIVSLLVNIKILPLCWHFRFYRCLFRHWVLRKSIMPGPRNLFAPVVTASRSPLYECDLNLHKSNSTYFSDLDIARTHLMAALSKRSFAGRRKRGDKMLYVALAGVTASFKKEIKPFAKYYISTRILGWDQKWIFLVSHFVSEKDREGKRRVYATSLSKYVFKAGRQTIPPEVVLRESGLIVGPALTEGGVSEGFPGEGWKGDVKAEVEKLEKKVELGPLPEPDEYWTAERIEEERKRGLAIAGHFLKMEALHEEFREGDEEGLEHVGRFNMCR